MKSLLEGFNSDWHLYGLAAAYLLGSWLLAFILRRPLLRLLTRTAAKSQSTADDRLVAGAARPLSWILIIAGLKLAVATLRDLPAIEKHTVFQWVERPLIPVLTIIAVTYLVDSLARAALNWYRDESTATWDKLALPLIKRTVSIVLGFIALSMILAQFGQNITALITTAGVASLGIAFAAQETLANMIAGFTVMMDRPFRIGDTIEFSDGKLGVVMDIGLRSTKIRQYDGNALIIPNKDIAGEKLVNYNLPNPMRAVREQIGIGYDADIERAKAIAFECLVATPGILADPEPACYYTGLGPGGHQLFCVGWVEHYNNWFATKEQFLLTLQQRFRAAGISYPLPRTAIEMAGPPLGKEGAPTDADRH